MTENEERDILNFIKERKELNESLFYARAPYVVEGYRKLGQGLASLIALIIFPGTTFYMALPSALSEREPSPICVLLGIVLAVGAFLSFLDFWTAVSLFKKQDFSMLRAIRDLERGRKENAKNGFVASAQEVSEPVPSPNPVASADAIVPPPVVLIDDELTPEPVEEKPRVDLERELEGAANRLVEERRAEQFEEVYNLRANAAGFSLEPFHRAGRATSDKLGVDATELLDATTPAKVASAWPGFYAAALEAGKRNPTAARECAEEIRAARSAFAALPKDPRFNP
ncbi:MAG: hypothetical protein IJM30_08290 [Thermoguttaceae bacterium]|nr:hypothetical protein [Thermoguttaceae bacterium]